jgi:hypothetical protein
MHGTAQVPGDRRGDHEALADPRAALLVDRLTEDAAGDWRRLDRCGARPQAGDEGGYEKNPEKVRDPAV